MTRETVTAIADQLSRADRKRLRDRIAEADKLDRLMREPGGLPPVPAPVPLHRAGRDTTTERTTTP